MFKIANSGTVRVPAEILTRTESGAENKIIIQLTGRLLSQPGWDALFAKHAGEAGAGELSEVYRQNARLYADVFTAWDGVADEEGQALPLSQAALEAALLSVDGPQVNAALQQAVHELRFGAVRKN